MKHLFLVHVPLEIDTHETVIKLNGAIIEAYPSHHLDSMHGLPDISFILLDETDFFPPGQQDASDLSERYIAKSNTELLWLVLPMHRNDYWKG
jgi:hypothetical protein